MRLHQTWTLAIFALSILNGAAFAEVTVSQSNDPATLIGTQFASLMGAEHKAVKTLSEDKRALLATGTLQAKPTEKLTAKKAKAGKTKAAPAIEYSHAFLANLPKAGGDEQWQCLTKALYFEARGETLKGQFAVAEVILNRVDSKRYPNSVCGVVEQGGKGACQFSYHCDGARDVMRDKTSAETAGRIARLMLDGAPRQLTFGATHFHTRAVKPSWSRKFERTASIGAHLFYRP